MKLILTFILALTLVACTEQEYLTDPGRVLCDEENNKAYQLDSARSAFVVRRPNLDKLCKNQSQ